MELLLLESFDDGIVMDDVEEADDDTEVDIVDDVEKILKSHIAAMEGLLSLYKCLLFRSYLNFEAENNLIGFIYPVKCVLHQNHLTLCEIGNCFII